MRKLSLALPLSTIVGGIVGVGAFSGTAFAGGQSGDGACSGSGTSIGCVASVPGSPGNQPPGGPGSSGGEAGSTGSSPVECSSAPANNGAAPPPGAGPGGWYYETCASTIQPGTGPAGSSWTLTWVTAPPPPPPPNPADVAAQAESQITLPTPSIGAAPGSFGIVNLPEWLWVDPATWHGVSTSATACNAGGCVTATAVATPSYSVWTTGDGSSVTCGGPGTVLNLAIAVAGQSTDCSHTYGETSAVAGPAGFSIGLTVYWTGSWSASGAASGSGSFGPLTTTATRNLPVQEIEAVNALP